MKTLLIRLPSNLDNRHDYEDLMQPYGLACISGMLKKHGFETILFDAQAHRLLRREILDYISEIQPDLIGITAYTSNLLDIISLLPDIKRNLPHTKLVLGGAHITVAPEWTLKKFSDIDYGVIGEGEFTCLELVQALEKKKGVEEIRGLAYRNGQNVFVNEHREPIENLDDLPFADWASLPMNKYFGHHTTKKNYVKLLLSRGCPYHCTFCAVHNTMGNKLRKRSPENITEELKLLYEFFHVRDFGFGDSTFNIDKKWVRELCEAIITMDRPINWRCNVRAKGLDRETVSIMKKAGCIHVTMGIESGDPEMLKSMRKQETLEEYRKAIHLLKEAKLPVLNSFIIGMPGETPESIGRTLQFAKDIKTYAGFNLATPFPGTVFYEQARKEGALERDLTHFNPYDLSYVPRTMTQEELRKAYRELVRSYYFRPVQLMRYLLGIKSFFSLKVHLHALIRLIKKQIRMKTAVVTQAHVHSTFSPK